MTLVTLAAAMAIASSGCLEDDGSTPLNGLLPDSNLHRPASDDDVDGDTDRAVRIDLSACAGGESDLRFDVPAATLECDDMNFQWRIDRRTLDGRWELVLNEYVEEDGSAQTAMFTHSFEQATEHRVRLWRRCGRGRRLLAYWVAFVHERCADGCNTPPLAAAGDDRTAELPPGGSVAVQFNDAGSSDSQDTSLFCVWTFEGGQPASAEGPAVQASFTTAGPHTVTLTVTDSCGASHSDSLVVNVVDACEANPCSPDCNHPPVANAGADKSVQLAAGQTSATINFAGSATDADAGQTLSYAWSFSGGSPDSAAGQNVSATFAAGTYTATLTVTDPCGARHSDTASVVVNAAPAPVDPQLLGFVPGLGNAADIVISENRTRAYVASREMGLVTVDISVPQNPTLLGSQDQPSAGESVAIGGNLALLGGAGSTGTSRVLSIAGSTPVVLASIPFPASGVALAGSLGCLAAQARGLCVYDLSVPSSPRQLACLNQIHAMDVAISQNGRWAYIAAASSGFAIIDLAVPSAPSVASAIDTPGSSSAVSLQPGGRTAAVSDGVGGVHIIDITNPFAPVRISTITLPGGQAAGQVAFLDSSVLGVCTNFSVFAYDVRNPAAPALSHALSHHAVSIAGSQGLVATARLSNGISCLRLDSGQLQLAPLGQLASSFGSGSAIACSGALCLVGSLNEWTLAIDVGDPMRPRIVSRIHTAAQGLAILGSVAYAAGGPWGLQTIDISNPAEPVIVNSLPVFARDVELSRDGSLAFVTTGPGGLHVYSIQSPSSPQLIAVLDTPGIAGSLCLDNNPSRPYAYLADEGTGILIIDVADPIRPRILGSTTVTGSTRDISVVGVHAYVTNSLGDLYTVNCADPANPRVLRSASPGAVALRAYGSRLAVVTPGTGVALYQVGTNGGLTFLTIMSAFSDRFSSAPASVVFTPDNRAFIGHNAASVVTYDLDG
jgi:hypothetical protein